MRENNVVAGIVLYNADKKRLVENIQSIQNQVNEIIFFDNGSKNIKEIKKTIYSINKNWSVIEEKENQGIAFGLNRIAELALRKKYNWLLTLDDDTICYPDLIRNYERYLKLPNVGQLSCKLIDRNVKQKQNILKINKKNINCKEVKFCITSGTLLNLKAWKDVGGFNETYFIDWVDKEMCCALRKMGYKTYEINFIGILQEMGKITQHYLFGKEISVSNYPPIRYYYISRNSVRVARQYPDDENLKRVLTKQLRYLIKVILCENNKVKKTKALLTGIISGLKYKESNKRI